MTNIDRGQRMMPSAAIPPPLVVALHSDVERMHTYCNCWERWYCKDCQTFCTSDNTCDCCEDLNA